ncbi:hypothetical protein P280DRAFT_406434 [Massarina eburnea CBS 473.64]|uniref:Peptidase A1 domain-containing protein n=1 Tax=Massarina eburnea CBS 473.64 TaxID=1395130 RepID=A0A6A6RUP4_9PLEO|nr:hypothetical protein P280DRAFT_406434 [Massarina eburnea CBS 473.64]
MEGEQQGQSRVSTTVHSHRRRRLCTTVFLAIVLVIRYHQYAYDTIMATRIRNADLSGYTQSIFLPYVHPFSSEEIPIVQTTVNGIDIDMPVDTGSTGLLIGAPLLPDIDPTEGTKIYHYLTSSTILYIGRLVSVSVTFHGSLGSSAVARVPALIVDESFRCPWYNPKKDTDRCPRGPNGEEAERRDTRKITYMGIGFGRNKAGSGQPNATPGCNPFLNIIYVNGTAVSRGALRSGYIISTRGVDIGLTTANTRGFLFASLEPGVTHREDSRDWAMVRANLSINGKGGRPGYGLVDTGIPQMYIRAEDGVSIPTVMIPNPDPNGTAEEVERVKPGTRIGIGALSSGREQVMEYSFVVGKGASKMEPCFVKEGRQTPPPFVNTGRNFFFGYDVAFDAAGGRFGFRAAMYHVEWPQRNTVVRFLATHVSWSGIRPGMDGL